MAEEAQRQQDRRYAAAPDVAAMNNISVDAARARIDRATASQSGALRTPEGVYYNPDVGRYSTDITTIGRDPSYWSGASMGYSSPTIAGAYSSGGRGAAVAGGGSQAGGRSMGAPMGTTDASGRATIGSIYGSGSVSGSGAMGDYQRYLASMSAPVDEERIRQDAINRVQSEIDAMNRYYAEKTRQEQTEARGVGESRLGQNAAINARRGMIGSDFGAARTSTIEQANAKVQNDIAELNNAQRLQQQAAIMGRANSAADALIAKKQAQLEQSLKEAVTLQQQLYAQAEKRVDTRLAGLIAEGQEPTEQDFEELASEFGIDVPTLKAKYATAKPRPEAVEPIKVGESLVKFNPVTGKYEAVYSAPAEAETMKPIEVSPGASLYDPVTKKFIGTAPPRPEDNKPEVRNFADNTTRQYNPSTGKWEVLAYGTESTSTKPPVVTDIGGQKMVWDESVAQFRPAPVQATAATPANTQQLEDISRLANELLADEEGLGDAVGPLSSRLPTLEGSTADFEARHAQLKSLLTRDALSAFKGFGPLSDRDLKIAEDSASSLSLGMSEAGYRRELGKILANVSNLQKQAQLRNVEQQRGVTLSDQQKNKVYEAIKNPEFRDLSVEQIWDSLGFKQESQPSSNGSSTVSKTGMRTDRHNNPTAFTTDIARVAGLREGVDYEPGDPFSGGQYRTARLLGDPIDTTIRVIDRIGFYTQGGNQRWSHTAIPKSQWDSMSYDRKKQVIKDMYRKEGGTQLKSLFA